MRSRVSMMGLLGVSLVMACGYNPTQMTGGLGGQGGGSPMDVAVPDTNSTTPTDVGAPTDFAGTGGFGGGVGGSGTGGRAGAPGTDGSAGGAGGSTALGTGGAALGNGGSAGGAGGVGGVVGTGGVAGGTGGRQDAGTRDDSGVDVPISPTGGVVGTGGVAGVGGTGGTLTQPVISSFTASPALISKGSGSTLSWTVSGATTLTIDQGVGAVTGATSKVVTPDQTTTYTLTARDASGATATAQVVLTVAPTPIITSFTATPSTANVGSTVSLSAVFIGSQGTIDQGIGSVTSGVPRATGPLLAPTTFTLTVVNELGETATTKITVGVVGFVVTGATASARLQHAAVLLANGKVLIVGGFGASASDALASAELYDPSTGKFTATGSMGSRRFCSALGNEGINGSLRSAELFDPAAGTFAPTGAMATARQAHMMVLLPTGNVLVAGGYSTLTSSAVASAELYDPTTGTFSATDTLKAGLQELSPALISSSGKVLFAGGRDTNEKLTSSAEVYDPLVGTFQLVGAMSIPRQFATATCLQTGKVLIAGGYNDSATTLASSELYDPAIGTFLATNAMATARYSHTATLLETGKVLVAGGYDTPASIMIGSGELYDPSTGSFSAAGTMITPRQLHTATAIADRKVLLVGGTSNTTAELYYY